MTIPNIKIAKKQVLNNSVGFFDTYSCAYIVTNEAFRQALNFMPTKTENALVVAGSGDFPIFSALYGAKHVDSFDVTYNSKIIMDIKTAAIKTLKYTEYKKLLKNLYSHPAVMCVQNMDTILNQLVTEEQEYIKNMFGYPLFNAGLHPEDSRVETFLSSKEFYKAREIIDKPFDFIWTDIEHLSSKLSKKYDFIHLSNIFDYMNDEQVIDILHSLTKYTRPECNICITCLWPMNSFSAIREFTNKNKKWRMIPIEKDFEFLYVLQR